MAATTGYTVTLTESREAYERRRAADPGAYRNQGVEHHQADTLEEMRRVVKAVATQRWELAGRPMDPRKGWHHIGSDNFPFGLDAGGEVPLPDGSTISVKPDEEGR